MYFLPASFTAFFLVPPWRCWFGSAPPLVAEAWIGDLRTLAALRIFAAFLPVVCLGGVMTDTSPQPGGFGSWWRWKFWSKWFLWR